MIIENACILDRDTKKGSRYILIEDGRISRIYDEPIPCTGHEIMDACDDIVIPGVINVHAHGITESPLFSSAAPSLSDYQVGSNLDRHLSEGTTTILSGDGFALPDDVREHSMNVKISTTHYPTAFESGRLRSTIAIF